VERPGSAGACAPSRVLARSLVVVSASAFVAAVTGAALADPTPREPLRLVYKSEGLCPAGERFFAEVRARTEKIRAAEGDERARTLRVEVEEGASESRGQLVVVAADGTPSSTRTVRAKTCQDVASALALVAALAIDPEARTSPSVDPAPPPPADAGEAPSPAPPLSAAPPDASATAASPRPSPPPRDAGAEPRAPEPPSSRGEPSPTQYRGFFGFGAEGSTLLEVRPAFAIELGLDVLRGGPFSPSIALRASRSFTGEAILPAGTANVTFNALALEPCVLRLELTASVAVLPCARVSFGFVQAEGSGITAPLSSTRGWGDVGAHVKALWNVAGPLRLSGHAGARFPLFRDRFFVEPNETLYEAPPAVFAFGGDLGVLFP